MLLMFMSTVTIFYNGKKLDSKEYKLKTKDNIIMYFAIIKTWKIVTELSLERNCCYNFLNLI